MHYEPQFVSFSEADTFDGVIFNLVNADTGVSIAGAGLGVPPIVSGQYQIDLAFHGFSPATNPALADVSLKAKIVVKLGTTAVSNPVFSEPFTFVAKLSDPFDVTVS